MDSYARDRLSIARIRVDSAAGIDEAYAHAARVSARTLGVRRVGIWLFEDDRQVLRCVHLLDADAAQPAGELPALRARDFPSYVAALLSSRWVCADDVRREPATRELLASYLGPLGIGAMLDAPILSHGVVQGVVCHEHVGGPRSWTPAERAFAGSVADVVALAMEAARRLELEEQLRAQEEALRLAERLDALGRLSASVAHDVNNFLQLIDGLVAIALRTPLEPKAKEALAEVRATTGRGAGLMRRLLAFGRGEPGELARVDLAAVLRSTELMLRTAMRERCALRLDLPPRPALVLADPAHLEQIVMNLAINARDAMPAGGELHVSLKEEIGPDGRQHLLAVRDQGIGMDEATKARVFEPFFTTKSPGEGTGLGLSTVYGLVNQLGGSIAIESALGEGTRVEVRLPAM